MTLFVIHTNKNESVTAIYTSLTDAEAYLKKLTESQKDKSYPIKYTLKLYNAESLVVKYNAFRSALIQSTQSLLHTLKDDEND